MPFLQIAQLGAAGTARWLLPKLSRWQQFREVYSRFQNHPFGFGVLYAAGTTAGYNYSPFHMGGKYMGRPQKLRRL